jgi:hypothetical protein
MAAEIQNCPLRAEGRCPDDWEAMAPTSDGRVRKCQECGHLVFLCRTRDDALFFGRHGWRVALAEEAGPSTAPAEMSAAWAEQLSHCFAGAVPVWGGSPAARWHAREALKAAVVGGATMADILRVVRTFLQDRGASPDHVHVQLDKVRSLTF